MMKKVVVIGHMDWQGNNMIGAVVKARNIYEKLQDEFEKECLQKSVSAEMEDFSVF